MDGCDTSSGCEKKLILYKLLILKVNKFNAPNEEAFFCVKTRSVFIRLQLGLGR